MINILPAISLPITNTSILAISINAELSIPKMSIAISTFLLPYLEVSEPETIDPIIAPNGTDPVIIPSTNLGLSYPNTFSIYLID